MHMKNNRRPTTKTGGLFVLVLLSWIALTSASLRGINQQQQQQPEHVIARRQLMQDRETPAPSVSLQPSAVPSIPPSMPPSMTPSTVPSFSFSPSTSLAPTTATEVPSSTPTRSPTKERITFLALTPFSVTVVESADERAVRQDLKLYLEESMKEELDIEDIEDGNVIVALERVQEDDSARRYRRFLQEEETGGNTYSYTGLASIVGANDQDDISEKDIQEIQTDALEDTEELQSFLSRDNNGEPVLLAVQVGDRPPVEPPTDDDGTEGPQDDDEDEDDDNRDGEDDDDNTGVIIGIVVAIIVVLVVIVLLGVRLYKNSIPPPPPPLEDLDDEAEKDIAPAAAAKSVKASKGPEEARSNGSAKKQVVEKAESFKDDKQGVLASQRRNPDVQYIAPQVEKTSKRTDGSYLPPPMHLEAKGTTNAPSSISGASSIQPNSTFDSEEGTNRSEADGDSIAGYSLATDVKSLEERRDTAEDEKGAAINPWIKSMSAANPLPAAFRNYTPAEKDNAPPVSSSYISDTETEASVADQPTLKSDTSQTDPTIYRSNVSPEKSMITQILNGTAPPNSNVTDGEDSLLDTSHDSGEQKVFVDDTSQLDSDSDDGTGIYTTPGTVLTSTTPQKASKAPALGMFQSYESSDDEDIPMIPKRPVAADAGSDVPSDELNLDTSREEQDLSGFGSAPNSPSNPNSPSKADAIRQGLESYENPAKPTDEKERKRIKKATRKTREGRKQPPVQMEV